MRPAIYVDYLLEPRIMDLDLQFRLLKAAPSNKVLLAFRKDADASSHVTRFYRIIEH